MAIAHDANSSSKTTSSSSLTYPHTCTGSDLLLVVGVAAQEANRTVSGITYNSVALTKVDAQDIAGWINCELWYLKNPATGANNVVVTMAGSCEEIKSGGISLTGVDQTNPLDASNKATGYSNTPSVSVTTVANNCWVVDAVATDGGALDAVGANQTQGWKEAAGGEEYIDGGGGYEGPKTPAGAVTMSWSASECDWGIIAASFNPLVVATGPLPMFFNP